MTHRRRDLAIAAALLVFAAALWFWLIPSYAGSGDQVILPRLVAAVIGGLALAMLLGALLAPPPVDVAADDPFLELGGGEALSVLAVAAVWTVFALFVDQLGFYLGGGLALIGSYLLLGRRRPLPLALWTAGTLLAVHLVFEHGFQLPIPEGSLEQAILGD